MTFGSLIEEVQENIRGIPGADRIQRQEIARKLNLAQREEGAAMGIPRQYANIPSDGTAQVGAFSLPGDYLPSEVQWIEVVEITDAGTRSLEELKNFRIHIHTVTEANERYPRWEDSDYAGPPFLIYDPAVLEEGIQPVGFNAAKYRALLVFNAPEMVKMTDEPWAIMDTSVSPAVRLSGNFPQYHRLLSFYVTYEMMLKLGDDRRIEHYEKYRSMRMDMYSEIAQPQEHRPKWRRTRYAFV